MNKTRFALLRKVLKLPSDQLANLSDFVENYLDTCGIEPPPLKLIQTFMILVVDDEQSFRNVVRFHIEIEGIYAHACYAATGQGAIDILRTNNIDLAIIDLRLPDMSGLDVLAVAREQGVRSFMISGYDDDYTKEEALSLGAEAYIVKPYNFELFAAILRSL